MKRALLIAGGTVGGLGAVLSVTPPQLGNNGLSTLSGASAATSLPATTSNTSNSAATTASTPAATAPKAAAVTASKSTPAATTTKKKTTTSTATAAATPSASASTATSAPAATPTTKSSVSGSFTGDAINVGYGIVQVKITVNNGKITAAEAVQNPIGRSQRFSDYAIPNLKQQTLAAQSAAIQGVSGASYTSYGWYKSLISALNKAGMPTGV